MEWSQKRKVFYSIILVVFLILLAAYPVYQLVHKDPTCFDQIQNGTETGVDCGGTCSLVCSADVKPPHVMWANAFSLDGGNVYDIGAYIENTNTTAGVKGIHYAIRVLAADGTVLVEKKGVTELAPASRALLFETGVTILGTPSRVEVIFDQNDLGGWLKATTAPTPVVTKNQSLININTKPRLDAVLVNTDLVNDVPDLSISAIIYDSTHAPIAISKTYVLNLPKGSEQNIFFTWPNRLLNISNNFSTEILITPRAIFTE